MRRIRRSGVGLVWLALTSLTATGVSGQNTNQITAISPDSAGQGTSGVAVSFTLDADMPPAPPAGILPDSVTIGSISGQSITHASQYLVTATFEIPVGEPVGLKDASITFTTPHGTLIFSMDDGFTVTAGVGTAPVITQHPQSQSVFPGGHATFSVTASGTAPLSFQWEKDGADLPGATGTFHTIDPVSQGDAGSYRCVVDNAYGTATSGEAVLTVMELPTSSYPVVDGGQSLCYDDVAEIPCPAEGTPFYGQDAQHNVNTPSYTLSSDGLTAYDNVTHLTWQRSPDRNRDGAILADDKLTWTDAQTYPGTLNAEGFGGFNDWRLPTIKELYSLIDFRGTDPSGCDSIASCPDIVPFIDTDYFDFAYGDTAAGERLIDAQYASRTQYVSTVSEQLLFGVNFADGRIKGYGLIAPGGGAKTFFVICVRGMPEYGVNHLVDNGDGTITDLATGLMWMQQDSGEGLVWEDALAYAGSLTHAGHTDWRLPTTKELQSILDYTRSPDTTTSAAINPVFHVTSITNEAGQLDYPCFWTSDTHGNWMGSGDWAVYVAFGRAMGYMNGTWRDVHGAGAQRSDPKRGDPADWPYGHGPQGDAVRVYNDVRCVRTPWCPGDLSHDGHVNVDDYQIFSACATGPAVPMSDPGCAAADFDGDDDIDQFDFGALQVTLGMSGPPCR